MKLCSRILSGTALAASLLLTQGTASAVLLADQPVFAASDVPGNLALALSVEYPTAISVANLGNYADATEYLGYFDPKKCYAYSLNAVTPALSYFESRALATGANKHSCDGTMWSGNFMNWATMQTIDPFRWALSGGFRSVDTVTETVIEKAWGSNQGGDSNFPRRGTDGGGGHDLPASLVPLVTPFGGTTFNTRIFARGNRMVFGVSGNAYDNNATPRDFTTATEPGSTFQVYVRVKVCDATAPGGLEANCVKYGNNYKPEGLLQQYSNKIRYSAFAYLNAGGDNQQGAVMRAQMGFIGPTHPQPLSPTVVTNPRAEWSATTGIMGTNPDAALATDSGVLESGVMNYLNKFGQTAKTYMTYDTVSELYYSVLRYFQNLGNVTEWTANLNATKLDGFPAPTNWAGKDPISYSCQKNFILGIGDNNTHFDRNVGGGTLTNGRTKPAQVTADTLNQAATWTSNVEALEGLTGRNGAWGNNGSQYIAGLAYGAHVMDIRPDITDKQTITTYWMDVMEYQVALDRNPYWLAAKYGGFQVPSNYDINNTTSPLTQNWWNTGAETINMNGANRLRPDNYFLAGNAQQMVDGLKQAFVNIANAIKAFTTSFSLSTAQVSSAGAASYASQYDSKGWTGVITASTITFASDGTPSSTVDWVTSNTMEAQLAGNGWNTSRNIVTWNAGSNSAVPFRLANLTTAQKLALNPDYTGPEDSANYLNYLRGDRTNEKDSTITGSTQAYRSRTLLLGDIVGSKVTPVAAPQMIYSESINPGYTGFKTLRTSRPTMVYVGGNDGMLHAFYGAKTGVTAGKEAFAYVPSAVFNGPNGAPQTDGLAQLGRANYAHRNYVDATAVGFDMDFNRAAGVFTTTNAASSDWRTVLIGGLGKGGRGFYAIDITDPTSMTSEAAVAGKVLWEFTDATMGYGFGAPTVVKTRKYGWVVVFTSGYNNPDNRGYLYFVDPRNGTLLEKVSTPTAAPGLTHASAYVQDYTDGTSDSFYAGDLNGQLWRFDVTAATGLYPEPVKLATLTDGTMAANPQPITTPPLIEIQPVSKKRFVMFGTGQLLDSSDVNSAREQTFYAIIDGNASGFRTGVVSPVTRADLTPILNLASGATLPNNSLGWYLDLGMDSSIGLRLVNNPVAFDGIVAFASLLTTGDACSPGGSSRIYAIDFSNGSSALVPAGDYVGFTTSITDLRFISVDGKARLVAGDVKGTLRNIGFRPPSSVGLRLLNWREVPTVD
ncbi:MAG: PilC/PilY family type IV pilus protein [Variovorax sp.]